MSIENSADAIESVKRRVSSRIVFLMLVLVGNSI